jgi:hypothetical protein
MSASTAKFYCRIFDYQAQPALGNNKMVFTIEWKRIDGDFRGGKFKWSSPVILTEQGLRDDMIDALVAYLHSLFPAETFRQRDIIGPSI